MSLIRNVCKITHLRYWIKNNTIYNLLHPRYWITKDIEISTDKIASGCMDNGNVYIDYFYNGGVTGQYIIYSAGIGNQINFEIDIIRKLKEKGINVELFAFDPTPSAIKFISSQNVPKEFHFFPYAISKIDGPLEFALPREEGWISGSAENVKNDERNFDFKNKIIVQGRSIESIMKELGHDKVDLLKMDIEGSEFSVLSSDDLNKLDIIQMSIDHHEYMFKHGNRLIKELEKQLRNAGYKFYYVEKNEKECRNFGCIRGQYIN